MRSPGIEATAASLRPSRPPLVGTLAWLIGLGLIAGMIAAFGADQVTAAVALAGWSLGLIGLAHLGTLLADTLGWRALLWPPQQPPLWPMVVSRWIGSSVNALLPVAQVGGEFVRVRLLAGAGIAGPVAGASVVVDVTIGLVTQVVFVLLGIGLYLAFRGDAVWLLPAGAGLAAFSLLLLGFGLLQRRGLFLRLARILERVTRGRAWQGLVGSAANLDREIVARYQDRGRLAACAAWRLLGWLWGSSEVWLAFWLLGHPVGVAEAVILESLGQTMRSVGFMLPGGLGAQEGGIVAGGLMLGIPPDLALSIALIKRARELAYGVPGLVAWALVGAGASRPIGDHLRRPG
jgi:putative membrane protein